MTIKLKSVFGLLFMAPLLSSSSEPTVSPKDVVHAFHEALASGDTEAALEQLDPAVTIFESGGAELSRDEYASHHLASDMKFSSETNREIVAQEFQEDGQTAWVLTRSTTSGQFRDKEIDAMGVETVLLRHTNSGWRIFHIHWSSRSRKSSH